MNSENSFLINLFNEPKPDDSQLRASLGSLQGLDAQASSIIPAGSSQMELKESDGEEAKEPKEFKLNKARDWQFTFNKIELFPKFKNYIMGIKSLNYCIATQEKAPTTGHLHIHFYCQFKNCFKPSIKKIKECSVHVEQCFGSPEQNVAYIKKDNEPEKRGTIIHEWGELRKTNKFPSIKEVKDMDDKERDELPLQFYNQVEKIRANEKNLLDINSLQKDLTVTYIWGPSGKGKSCLAKLMINELRGKFNMVKHVGNFWHGVSEDCEIAFYDDFRDSDMLPREFINFIDYNSHNMNIKGGVVKNKYKYIFITSIQDPQHIYAESKLVDETRTQWLRRMEVRDIKTYNSDLIIKDYISVFGEFKPKNLFNNLLNKYLND